MMLGSLSLGQSPLRSFQGPLGQTPCQTHNPTARVPRRWRRGDSLQNHASAGNRLSPIPQHPHTSPPQLWFSDEAVFVFFFSTGKDSPVPCHERI